MLQQRPRAAAPGRGSALPFLVAAQGRASPAHTPSALQELAARYLGPSGRLGGPAAHTPPGAAALAGGGLARQASLGRSLDVGPLTAAVVLAMYQAEEELVLLSELQVWGGGWVFGRRARLGAVDAGWAGGFVCLASVCA
jgi:hypothetical protein